MNPIRSCLNRHRWIIGAFIAVLVLTGGIELWLGRSPLGPDGKFGLWEGNIWSSENSQRFADPYSFSHLVHGILFYAGLWLVARKLPVRYRLLLALLDVLATEADESPPSDLKHSFKFDWEDGLADAFHGLTSVKLQHKVNEWR